MRLALVVLASAVLATAARAEDLDAIPSKMRGTWDWDAKACRDKADDGRVSVTAGGIEFFASSFEILHGSYNVHVVSTDKDGTVHVSGLRQEEGNEAMAPGEIKLKLLAPDRLTIDEPDHAYVRCND